MILWRKVRKNSFFSDKIFNSCEAGKKYSSQRESDDERGDGTTIYEGGGEGEGGGGGEGELTSPNYDLS